MIKITFDMFMDMTNSMSWYFVHVLLLVHGSDGGNPHQGIYATVWFKKLITYTCEIKLFATCELLQSCILWWFNTTSVKSKV